MDEPISMVSLLGKSNAGETDLTGFFEEFHCPWSGNQDVTALT
jgi:hypothetical protein